MAIAFRSASPRANTTASSISPTEPSGATQNDILLYWVVFDESGANFTSGPSGWTLLNNFAGTATNTRLYWIRRGSSPPTNYTTTLSASTYIEAIVLCYSGCETSGSPFHQAQYTTVTSSNPSNPNPPSVTTTIANTMAVIFGMGWWGWDSNPDAPSGYTKRGNAIFYDDLVAAEKALASATTEDPAAFTQQSGSAEWCAATVVLMEPQSTGVTATGAFTLGTTTASAAGAVALAATSATTTTAATVAAVANAAVAATATPTLTAATVSGTATVATAAVEATSSLTLAASTAASTATVAIAAASAPTLGAATAVAAAAVAITASSAVTTTAAAAASAATAAVAATATVTLTAATASGSATSETPQYGRPISDIDATGWTASGGGALYAMVDEATYNDADYIYTETPDADAEVAITSLSDPSSSAGHVVRYRARALNGGQIKVSVYQSTTLVQEWTDTPTDEFATIEHLVTNSVTDYSAIRLRFTALQGT
jgi:hypothetical protein